MHKWIRAACVLGVMAGLWSGLQAQEKKATPAAKAQAATPGGIAWAASYDLAMTRMGADATPVILYFTYDG
jgi:hypothetical protein